MKAEAGDFYFDGPYCVFTEAYHLRRGSCCGNGCRHCPYEPKHRKGATARGCAGHQPHSQPE